MTSEIIDYYSPPDEELGQTHITCDFCGDEFSVNQDEQMTDLINHLKNRHPQLFRKYEAEK